MYRYFIISRKLEARMLFTLYTQQLITRTTHITTSWQHIILQKENHVNAIRR